MIVFREGRDDEQVDFVPITRWLKLPQGVYIESNDLRDSKSPGDAIPQLNGQRTGSLTVLKFDRFGKLFDEGEVVIRVGQKAKPDEDFMGAPINTLK